MLANTCKHKIGAYKQVSCNSRPMNTDYTYKGFWWLPENPDDQFSGDLEIDETGTLTLTVLDSRQTDNLRKRIEKVFTVPIINGYARNKFTKKDLAFTLFNNSISSYSISGLAEFSFQCQYATTYNHYKTPDSLQIGSVFLEAQLINEWTGVSGIKDVKNKAIKTFKFSLDYEQPKPITLLKNKEFHLYIWFYANHKKNKNSFELNEKARINIEFKKKVDFNQLNKHIELIQNFLSFCISVPVSLQKIEFREHSNADFKRLKLKHQSTFDIFISDRRTYTSIKSIRSNNMLVEYNKIANNETFYISKWLELNKKLEPVFKLYFDTLYNPGLYKENAFLNNVAALEIYHRINNPDFNGKNDEYSKKLEKILNQISKGNEKQWLKVRLEKRKETSLFNRLINIVERTPTLSKRLVGDFNGFATIISNTRHYLTHFDYKNKEKGIAEGDELVEMIGKTRLLIQIQILLDLGFSETETNTLIKKAFSNWFDWNK